MANASLSSHQLHHFHGAAPGLASVLTFLAALVAGQLALDRTRFAGQAGTVRVVGGAAGGVVLGALVRHQQLLARIDEGAVQPVEVGQLRGRGVEPGGHGGQGVAIAHGVGNGGYGGQ